MYHGRRRSGVGHRQGHRRKVTRLPNMARSGSLPGSSGSAYAVWGPPPPRKERQSSRLCKAIMSPNYILHKNQCRWTLWPSSSTTPPGARAHRSGCVERTE
jgi:hypothetical protein